LINLLNQNPLEINQITHKIEGQQLI